MAATSPAVQYGHKRSQDMDRVRQELGSIAGPIPRQLYETLRDEDLASEIEKRWTMRRFQMSSRVVMDQRLLRYMDPEIVQHHWQNFWTGASLKKLEHSNQLTIGVFNWPRAIVESLTGLLTGSDDALAYSVDVVPRNSEDIVSRTQASAADSFVNGFWIPQTEYERTFMRGGSDIYALGRRAFGVITQTEDGPLKNLPKVSNVWPGSLATFWHENHETLECVIVGSEMLPAVAAAMYPGNDDKIMRAIHEPSAWRRYLGAERPWSTWDLNSTVTVLTCWYRTTKATIGQAVVLLDSPLGSATRARNLALLDKKMDTGYPDIPYRVTPRFKTNDRPPDEAQGALYDIAPIATMYDEVVSAAKDMLYRAIYQRYKLSNAYGRPPQLIPNTSIIALRAGQDLTRLDDVLNSVPVDTFISRLEELMIIFPGLSRYFLGQAPPSETSGEAINAAINASIQRQVSTRTEARTDERWIYRQVGGQAAQFAKWQVNGRTVSMGPVLAGDFDYLIRWRSDNPKDAVKAKQLALAALKAGVIGLDTAQSDWGITNPEEEQRKILRYMSDPRLRPDMVALTGQALISMARAKLTTAQVDQALASGQAFAPQGAPGPGGNGAGQAGAASATVAGNMKPPLTEGDNTRGLPASQSGDQGQP